MPPDRGRASKACASCRKQKTRCYAGVGISSSCLRCSTLGNTCSFQSENASASPSALGRSAQISSTDERIEQLEKTVNRLLERLDGPVSRGMRPSREHEDAVEGASLGRYSRHSNTPKDSPPPPVYIIRDLAADHDSSPQLEQSSYQEDVISEGVISYQEATVLTKIFAEHYGRWLALDGSKSTRALLEELRQSNLLLCASFLIAVRHTTLELATRTATVLFDKAKSELSAALIKAPQTLPFFHASLILSMWSTTAGQTPLSIDSWLISGFALQHSLSCDVLKPVIGSSGRVPGSNRRLFSIWSTWNHLCLVHLHYCVGTRRKSMIDSHQISRCRMLLESDFVTNFEARMVAETTLYWCIYEHTSGSKVDLPAAQTALSSWKQEWKTILEQPRSQFLEMGFSFAQLLVFERSLHAKSARVRDSLLSEMARLSASIIQLAMDTTDDRTKHLTDHIYHIIAFSAVTLCRLLSLYESHLATTNNIEELDQLILNLVSWLHLIGLPCHVAFSLSNVVADFHKKLRPNGHPPSPVITEFPSPWMDSDLTQFIPGLLSTENEATFNFLPDWEPLYIGPLT